VNSGRKLTNPKKNVGRVDREGVGSSGSEFGKVSGGKSGRMEGGIREISSWLTREKRLLLHNRLDSLA